VVPSERIFRREGEYWTIAYEGKVIRLRHCKGLAYIAHLMAHAGREFHVADLSNIERCGTGPGTVAIEAENEGPAREFGDAGPELDLSAKSSYRERLQELRDELGEARSFNDLGRISKIEHEIEFISRELARAVGLGGRDRRACSQTERARSRVTMAVKSTVKKITEQHPLLGRYLARAVRTGNFCCFERDPSSCDPWQL
jgi:non-specific serine/threonine protein kinase